MTPLYLLRSSLGCAGVRLAALARILGPTSAQKAAATASTRVQVGWFPGFPQQAACFNTGSRLRTDNTAKSPESKDQVVQQLIVELLPELAPLGVTPQLLRKVLTCNPRSVWKAVTTHQLKDRFSNIYQLAAAETKEQRTLVNKQLCRRPVLLGFQASRVAANAAELRDILCKQFNIPATTVQQLITMQPSVLQRKPQSVAEQLQGWASVLQLDVLSVVQDVWCKNAGTENIFRTSKATVAAAFQRLQSVLQLAAGDAIQMVHSHPNILRFRADVLDHKLQVLSDLLSQYGWTQQQLGQALLTYPNVLTQSVDSLNLKWRAFHQYAAAHPPSQQQLQDKCRSSAMLRMFITPKQNIKLMQYIMQCYEQQSEQQRHGCPKASLAQRQEQQNGSASVINADPRCPHEDRPKLWKFVGSYRDSQDKIAADYPGFREWLMQQQG